MFQFFQKLFQGNKSICRERIMDSRIYKRTIPIFFNNWVIKIKYYNRDQKLKTIRYYYPTEESAIMNQILISNFCTLCKKHKKI